METKIKGLVAWDSIQPGQTYWGLLEGCGLISFDEFTAEYIVGTGLRLKDSSSQLGWKLQDFEQAEENRPAIFEDPASAADYLVFRVKAWINGL